MELTTVKSCFEKYVSFMKTHEGVSVDQYDLDSMTIFDIDKLTQTIFADYVIKCETKVNHMSVPCTLYKHLHTLIRQHIDDEEKKTIATLNDHIFKLDDDIKLRKEIKTNVSVNSSQKTGWFF